MDNKTLIDNDTCIDIVISCVSNRFEVAKLPTCMFWRNLLLPSLGLKMDEAVSSFKKLVVFTTFDMARCPENTHL
jgi:hypothetical protein